ncbi:hypothetical protein [Cohnella sp.]|uniref:hypothetical protein n=1 Tax=Cohnella sp. TaxID=1883426 RepID=UPI00370430BC
MEWRKGMVLPRVLALGCLPLKVLSILAAQNNLSEVGKTIPFEMQWASPSFVQLIGDFQEMK